MDPICFQISVYGPAWSSMFPNIRMWPSMASYVPKDPYMAQHGPIYPPRYPLCISPIYSQYIPYIFPMFFPHSYPLKGALHIHIHTL